MNSLSSNFSEDVGFVTLRVEEHFCWLWKSGNCFQHRHRFIVLWTWLSLMRCWPSFVIFIHVSPLPAPLAALRICFSSLVFNYLNIFCCICPVFICLGFAELLRSEIWWLLFQQIWEILTTVSSNIFSVRSLSSLSVISLPHRHLDIISTVT